MRLHLQEGTDRAKAEHIGAESPRLLRGTIFERTGASMHRRRGPSVLFPRTHARAPSWSQRLSPTLGPRERSVPGNARTLEPTSATSADFAKPRLGSLFLRRDDASRSERSSCHLGMGGRDLMGDGDEERSFHRAEREDGSIDRKW